MNREITEDFKKQFNRAFELADNDYKARLIAEALFYFKNDEFGGKKEENVKPFQCDLCNSCGRYCEETCDGFGNWY